jgi:hypothetical protein
MDKAMKNKIMDVMNYLNTTPLGKLDLYSAEVTITTFMLQKVLNKTQKDESENS